jgi:Flp pilus assembly protein TadD
MSNLPATSRQVVHFPLRLVLPGVAILGLGGYFLAANLWGAYHFCAAERALEQRDFKLARALMGPCLAVWPSGGRTHFLAARAAWRSGFYDEANEHLAVCRRQQWDAAALHCERALMQAQRGDRTVEEFLWSRLRQNDPETPLILEVLIQAYVSSYRLPQALNALNLYLQRRPDDVEALLGRGWVWEQLFDFGRAVADYRRAAAVDADNDAARLRLAETLLITGPASAALDQFERLRQHRPEDPAVLVGLARCRRQLGQLHEARTLLDNLLTRLHSDAADKAATILNERGRLALDEGQPGQAESWLRQAVALVPYDRQVNYDLYQCLRQCGRTDEAERCRASLERIDADLQRIDKLLREVLKSPSDPALRSEAGIIFLRNGEPQKGLRWLGMALEQDPGYRPAHQALADYYERTGRLDLAAGHRRLAR